MLHAKACETSIGSIPTPVHDAFARLMPAVRVMSQALNCIMPCRNSPLGNETLRIRRAVCRHCFRRRAYECGNLYDFRISLLQGRLSYSRWDREIQNSRIRTIAGYLLGFIRSSSSSIASLTSCGIPCFRATRKRCVAISDCRCR
jgi:hypothetical protein